LPVDQAIASACPASHAHVQPPLPHSAPRQENFLPGQRQSTDWASSRTAECSNESHLARAGLRRRAGSLVRRIASYFLTPGVSPERPNRTRRPDPTRLGALRATGSITASTMLLTCA
jgi:hypothetical protein